VATSYNGKGLIDETCPVSVGMLGTWGSSSANAAVKAADLVVVLGASLGPDYTGFREPTWLRPGDQRIVQVDIDPRHAGWVIPVDLALTADAADVLQALEPHDLGEDRRDARLGAIAARNRESGYGDPPTTRSAPGTLHLADIVRGLDPFRRGSADARCRFEPDMGDHHASHPDPRSADLARWDRRHGVGHAGRRRCKAGGAGSQRRLSDG
jgi:acetolactate synthase-1/2/3 large subunit